eukprot:scaffold66683_cov17-Tisochrysis_lutea.AAC.1
MTAGNWSSRPSTARLLYPAVTFGRHNSASLNPQHPDELSSQATWLKGREGLHSYLPGWRSNLI